MDLFSDLSSRHKPSTLNGILFPEETSWSYDLRRQMQEIIPGLFLGPYASATSRNKNTLIEAGITHIVCIRRSDESKLIREHFKGELNYKTIDLSPDQNQSVIPLFREVNNFIDLALRSNCKILVHGNNGASCSPVFVIAYIIARTDMNTDQALKYVMKRRFCVFPPENLIEQLQNFEAIVRASIQPIDIEMKQTVKRKMEECNDETAKRLFIG